MKKVVIVHGWGGSPDEPMLKWLGDSLETKGYTVTRPTMPNPAQPVIGPWVDTLKEVIAPDQDTILIGHSIGCQAVLRYLQTLSEDIKIGGVILIAPWMQLDQQTTKEEGEEVIEIARPWMETPIDFAKIQTMTNNVVAIFSDNDPYVPVSGAKLFKEKIDAHIIIEHNMGHFDPSSSVMELPSALEAVLKM